VKRRGGGEIRTLAALGKRFGLEWGTRLEEGEREEKREEGEKVVEPWVRFGHEESADCPAREKKERREEVGMIVQAGDRPLSELNHRYERGKGEGGKKKGKRRVGVLTNT